MKKPTEAKHLLQAFSVGEQALSRLRTGKNGVVHSVYGGALNLLFPPGMISVVNRSMGRGPLNAVLSGEDEKLDSLAVRGEEVLYGDGILTVGDRLTVSLRSARVYRSPQRFRRTVLNRDSILSNVREAQRMILQLGRLDGLGGLVVALEPGQRLSGAAANVFASNALPRVLSFIQALDLGDADSAVDASVGLLGLGIGLTPSGDDLLCGAFVAMVLGSRNGIKGPRVLREVASRTAKGAAGRTTLLSQNYVELASLGRANEPAIRFVEQIYTGGGEDLRRSLVDLIGFGATSGTDIAVGVTIGTVVAIGGPTRV